MEPVPQKIAELAVYDPIAAYGILLGIPRIPFVANSSVSFSSFDLEAAPLSAGLDTTIAYRTWISNLTYTINPVGQFAGNVFQTQYASYMRTGTGIGIKATVQSGPKYPLMGSFTALENFVNVFASTWPAGWQLYKQQNILTEFLLTAVPGGDDTNLSAYNVSLTWNGWQFIDPSLDDMDADCARECLREMGIWVPDFSKCKRRPSTTR
jgi:hypothetical protein